MTVISSVKKIINIAYGSTPCALLKVNGNDIEALEIIMHNIKVEDIGMGKTMPFPPPPGTSVTINTEDHNWKGVKFQFAVGKWVSADNIEGLVKKDGLKINLNGNPFNLLSTNSGDR